MAKKTEQKNLEQRPPIVVVMGHVDHGKTTLLDYIRKANIAAREAGGITQAVGAYEISHNGRKVTFIDTPGHEAFTAMRSRGAQAADLAVLVVAADEGVKPQTKEAIKILEETKTPFIVALNKIDKASGAVEKTKGDLAAAGVLLEGYGGQVSYHGVSAKTGEGVDDLLDLILLASDVEGLTYDPAAPASGYILEVRRDPQRGIEATVIIKEGVLKRGDLIRTQTTSGKVKILEDFLEKPAQRLTPSAPAIIIGFEGLPNVGETFSVGESGEKQEVEKARPIAGALRAVAKNSLNLILKASDGGSLEVLSAVLSGLAKKEGAVGGREVRIIDASVGDVSDHDVKYAIATGSTIIGFKNKVGKDAQNLAEGQKVAIITSKIVYDLVKAVEDFLTGAAGPAAAGELEVLAIFNQQKLEKQLIGGRVTAGTFRPKAAVDIMRRASAEEQEKKLGFGKVVSLHEKKTEITQAEKGKEIGVIVNTQVAVQIGDKLVVHA